MNRAKLLARWAVGGAVIFLVGNGLGYIGRTYECRSDRVRIYVAAPGYEAKGEEIPSKLYGLDVTRCTLPEQWGGYREPLEGYP
ncbi:MULTISPECIES: hypothetical protein [unclassified Pseudomonas]|uniref:hypothetical protein n=1 Tax=unclassified Pseudomonas TaxID=196821 RepID=UPI000BD989B3|nr:MULTISPECIES: hypothetical protein [unclassified Pseudomonas]PVZ19938.1 hypothetical protein F474_00529 [Pseudomonas sp. URIL14HWK12:I12]PVZ27004.1 hypothetical protein F470_00184 [Pseudomonas sp. URIL14HWK12:I10]PVZ37893.1 hypothetical protein F472_00529 [Pseudomonas sp. URIL14HWK12:I11]SNZ05246.1 hypothetical protein SAMN05660463_00875 [Pseudomonas sp. URIL14HWK12:I9]